MKIWPFSRRKPTAPTTTGHRQLAERQSWALILWAVGGALGLGATYFGLTEPGPWWLALTRILSGCLLLLGSLWVGAQIWRQE